MPAMRSTVAGASRTAGASFAPVRRAGTLPARTEAWRQRLVNLTLISSDAVLALFIWKVACLIQIWRVPEQLSGVEVASIVPVVLIWVGLRATQGLYPGYGPCVARS